MSTTGERIKEARLRAGLTQTELAEKIGVKFSAIHKYENGLVVNLKRETIQEIAKVLNVKPSYLLCMDEEQPTGLGELSDREIEFIRTVRQLPDEVAEQYLGVLKTLLDKR